MVSLKKFSALIAAILSMEVCASAQLFTDPNFTTLSGNIGLTNPTTSTVSPWTYGVNGHAASQGQVQKITGGITLHSNDASQGAAYAQQTSSSALLANTSYTVYFSLGNNGSLQLIGSGAVSFTSTTFVGLNSGFKPNTYTFTTGATSGFETIQFDAVGSGGVNIDLTAVSLSANTPEPSSIFAVTLVLLGICAAERRRVGRFVRGAAGSFIARLRA